jgi:ribosomal protein S18 acetylase RimI-like enzyme
MQIINSTIADTDTIFTFYDYAIAYQKTKFNKHWQGFDLELVQTEINEKRQWKIVIDDTIVCIFAITFNDPVIWGERDEQPAIYIHRIVTHPDYRGHHYVTHIVTWAKQYCKENDKQFIRLDTWGDNQKLIDHYIGCGFTFLGLSDQMNSLNLPKHYEGIQLSLFEIKIE